MGQQALARIVAGIAHFGQTDLNGDPYIRHPIAVSHMVTGEKEKTVALLHDVVEDTWVSLNFLRRLGFSKEVVEAVDALTYRADETRAEYIVRVSDNQLATIVKIADLTHNSDISRISKRPLHNGDIARVHRYQREKKYLLEVLHGFR